MYNSDLVNARIRDTSKSKERVLSKLKINSFSLQLVYFLIETQVTGYGLVNNSPFIWCMAKLGAKHYITISLWTKSIDLHTHKMSACFVHVHLCLQHSKTGFSSSWINCTQEILSLRGISNIRHVQDIKKQTKYM
jgi:hypothetical protein